jgi:HEAT repeat protein
MHQHKCSLCETVWQHGEEWDNDVDAHECPACGCHQFRILKDADTAALPAAGAAPPAEPDPTAALGDSQWLTRARTAFALNARTAPAQQLVAKLAELLARDPYPLVRLAAVEALWRFGDSARPAIPLVTRALSDPVAYVRRAAALTLGGLGPAAGTARLSLTGRLTDSNAAVRAAALAALKNIGPDSFSPVSEVWVVP